MSDLALSIPRALNLPAVPAWARRALGAFLLSRVVAFAGFAMAAAIAPGFGLLEVLTRWDGSWYVVTASYGYPTAIAERFDQAALSNIAFFPLYPMVVSATSFVTRLPVPIAAVLVANVLGALAACLLRALVARVAGGPAADRSVLLFCLFPGAFVLSMAYAESLMLALAIGCLIALHDRRWLLAGVLAALGTATRPNAIAIAVACGVAAVVAIHQRREWRALLAPALASLGLLSYFAYLHVHTGSWDAFLRVERDGWGHYFDMGWSMAVVCWRALVGGDSRATSVIPAVSLVFALLTIPILLRVRLPPPQVAYALVVVGLAAASAQVWLRPRFLLTAFPLVVAVAIAAREKRLFAGVCTISTGLLLLTTAVSAGSGLVYP